MSRSAVYKINSAVGAHHLWYESHLVSELLFHKAQLADVPGDGDCLFSSLSHALKLVYPQAYEGYDAKRIRQEVCDWLEEMPHFRIEDGTGVRTQEESRQSVRQSCVLNLL